MNKPWDNPIIPRGASSDCFAEFDQSSAAASHLTIDQSPERASQPPFVDDSEGPVVNSATLSHGEPHAYTAIEEVFLEDVQRELRCCVVCSLGED